MNEQVRATQTASILIVDDEDTNRRLLALLLEADGYAVIEAKGGRQALELARQNPPDLVLLDVLMPEMDGYEVARSLKAQEATRAVPIVMVTALHDRDSRLRALEAGAEEFVSKPVDRWELRVRVKNLLHLKEYQNFLAEHNHRLEEQVRQRTFSLVAEVKERTRAEAEVRSLNQELEQRVRMRTAELEVANSALQATIRKLALSNTELEQFAYVASHDLQEPLRMVASYVQLLQVRLGDKLDGDTREFMRFAVDGAVRMQEMIGDILAYSRIDSRFQTPQAVDSAQALQEALARLQSTIADTGAEIHARGLPTVRADRATLAQLFQNLIGNAIKFCKDRAPRIFVEAAHEAGHWRFTVTDNGIGIAPENRGQLFVIFKRLHTRDEYPGSGIGLAICRRIVERHGGEIGVEAAAAGGSVFWFTLPEK
jgi:signal transduction histidine kinase